MARHRIPLRVDVPTDDQLRRQLREAHVMVAAVVLAAGGRVVVTDRHIRQAYDSEIRRTENYDAGGPVIVFHVQPRSNGV